MFPYTYTDVNGKQHARFVRPKFPKADRIAAHLRFYEEKDAEAPANTQIQSRLLSLPAEVRLKIWQALYPDHKINTFAIIRGDRYWVTLPRLTITCRQMRNEVAPICYNCITFEYSILEVKHYNEFSRIFPYLHRVTVLGRARRGQVQITFQGARILDARWRKFMHQLYDRTAQHWHLQSELQPLLMELDERPEDHKEIILRYIPKIIHIPHLSWNPKGNIDFPMRNADQAKPCPTKCDEPLEMKYIKDYGIDAEWKRWQRLKIEDKVVDAEEDADCEKALEEQ